MTDPAGTLTPEQIRAALERVAAILSERGVTARIDVFGGASLALVHAPTRTATADVDGSYMPVQEVEEAADQVANEMGLLPGWLNNRMKLALPPTEIETEALIERPGVTIRVGSARTILAMKLRASRPGRDLEDIAVLLRVCNITSLGDTITVLDELYLGEEEIPERGRLLLDRAFAQVEIVNSDPPYTLPAILRSDQ